MTSQTINPATQKTTRRRESTEQRRRAILDAALRCFLAQGVAGTSIGQIRKESRASHGSIYHLFRSKDEIALTLFVEGMRVYHRKVLRALEDATTARECIRAIIATHLKDVVDNPPLSIYLTRLGMADDAGPMGEQFQTLNDEFVRDVWGCLRPFVQRGEIVRLAPELYFSLIVGPAAHLSRSWLRGRVDFDLLTAADKLATAAWKSLQSK